MQEPCVAQVSLDELSTVSDAIGTVPFYSRGVEADQSASTQLGAEVQEPRVAQVSLVEVRAVSDAMGTVPLYSQGVEADQSASTQLGAEVQEPRVAQVSLEELSTVGDTVGTTQLHSQCGLIDQDASTQLRSEVQTQCVAQVSLEELSAVGAAMGTVQLHNLCAISSKGETIMDSTHTYMMEEPPSDEPVRQDTVEIIHVHSVDGPPFSTPQNPYGVGLLPTCTDGREGSEAGSPVGRPLLVATISKDGTSGGEVEEWYDSEMGPSEFEQEEWYDPEVGDLDGWRSAYPMLLTPTLGNVNTAAFTEEWLDASRNCVSLACGKDPSQLCQDGRVEVEEWHDEFGDHSGLRVGTYHERIVEDLTRTVNTDSNGFSTIQSVEHIQREVVRQGFESHLVHGHYSHGSMVRFAQCRRMIVTRDGVVPIDISSFRCYRDMAAITRLVPTSSENVVDARQLPWLPGIIGKEGDVLPVRLPTMLPEDVRQELARFDECCAARDTTKVWTPSENAYVAAYASAVITTPMFMRASYRGKQFCVMVDLGASVSIYSDASLFPDVRYREDVAPIGITGVTGQSLRCEGAIQAPLTLSIDSFTGCPNMDYGACTVQTGLTGRRSNRSSSQEPVSMNSLCTNLTINFEGYHFPSAGPKTPIIGMDYFIRQSESAQYAVPKYVDFMNSCLHFQQPDSQHFQKMGLARVPTFSTVGVLPTHEVLLSTAMDVIIPPGSTAHVRLTGHCNKLASGPCFVQPHEALPPLKSQGSRRFLLSRYVVDPILLIPSQVSQGDKRDADAHLQWLYNLVEKDMGLIVVFGGNDELHDYTEIDGCERGESDTAYHVQIINTSPVEMVVLAGQPIATAIPAEYQEIDRDIEYLLRKDVKKDPVLKRMRPVIHSSLSAVNSIIQCVTRCEHGELYSDAKQKLLELDQSDLSDEQQGVTYQDSHRRVSAPLTWVPVHCMSKGLDNDEAVVNVPSLVGTVNVQRGLLFGKLME